MAKRLTEIAVDRITPAMEKTVKMLDRIMRNKVKKYGASQLVTKSKRFGKDAFFNEYKGRVIRLGGGTGPTVHVTRLRKPAKLRKHREIPGGQFDDLNNAVTINPSIFRGSPESSQNTIAHELFHSTDPGALISRSYKLGSKGYYQDPAEVSAIAATGSLRTVRHFHQNDIPDKVARMKISSRNRDDWRDPHLWMLMQKNSGSSKVERKIRQKVGKNLHRAYERVYRPETYVPRAVKRAKLPEGLAEAVSKWTRQGLRQKWSISPTVDTHVPNPEFDQVFSLWQMQHPHKKVVGNTLKMANERRAAVSKRKKLPEDMNMPEREELLERAHAFLNEGPGAYVNSLIGMAPHQENRGPTYEKAYKTYQHRARKGAVIGAVTGAAAGFAGGALAGGITAPFGAVVGALGGGAAGSAMGQYSAYRKIKKASYPKPVKPTTEELLDRAAEFLNEVVSRKTRAELSGPWDEPEGNYSSRDHLALLASNPGDWMGSREQQAAQNTLQMNKERMDAYSAQTDAAIKGDWFKERLSGKTRKEIKNAFKRSGVAYPHGRHPRKDRRGGSLDTLMTQWRKEHPTEELLTQARAFLDEIVAPQPSLSQRVERAKKKGPLGQMLDPYAHVKF